MTEQTGNNKPNEAEALAFHLSGNEKLIEETAKAMADGEHNVLGWRGHSEDEREWYRKDAAIALAVFEKALTRTDDERERKHAEMCGCALPRCEFIQGWESAWNAAYLSILRRTEVPEPSTEEWAARITAAREKAITKGYTPGHDAKHGVRHLLRWAIDYARRGRAEDSSGLVAAAIDLADIAYAELARLRHVADTMRAVSEALRTRYASDSQAAYFMRQIDAALEAVPEPQGEPSDAQITAEALRKWPHDPNDVNVSSARAARRLSFLQGALWMRAALRAGGVR